MWKGTATQVADVRGFDRSVRGRVAAAAILLAVDIGVYGSNLISTIVFPIWILVSLLNGAIHRPGWWLALVRFLIPALTLGIVYSNNAFQLSIAEANAPRVVAACEAYHAANGSFPRNLDELVPQYLNSVPVAKYCLGPSSCFYYSNAGNTKLFWQVVPPHYRKIYDFETRRWSYLD